MRKIRDKGIAKLYQQAIRSRHMKRLETAFEIRAGEVPISKNLFEDRFIKKLVKRQNRLIYGKR
jgi:hypothetical protein